MIRMLALITGLTITLSAMGQAPASAPAGATGMCQDGTYHTGATKSGACAGHKGVKDWYASAPANASSSAPTSPATPSVSTSTAPAATNAATPAPAAAKPAKPSAMAAAPGGGVGQVWVNPKSKVYHCSTDKWYGKTKKGEYMTEAAAKAAGNHSDHGKACA